jgi:protein-S-isoprenylcysteine O-methyltransferase Ste14
LRFDPFMIPLIISFVFWAIVHSVTASAAVKERVCTIIGAAAFDGIYRLAYNLFAVLSILPALYFLATEIPSMALWSVPSPLGWLIRLVQLAGVIGVIVSLLQRDIWAFAGIRQMVEYLNGNRSSADNPELITGGLYRLVRHPLYFFGMLVLWFNPTMPLNLFVFNALSTLYFWIGSSYEERRLIALHGDVYDQYRQEVPGLLPLKLPK